MVRAVSKALLFFAFATASAIAAQQSPPSLNSKPLDLASTQPGYSFLLVGHAFGSHNSSPLPASSLLASIEMINTASPHFMILLGDIMQRAGEHEAAVLQGRLLSKLTFPVFNTPGNHDVSDRPFYQRVFGPTYTSFQYQSELFILLDSEIEDGNLGDTQLEFLLDQIEQASYTDSVQNIVICMHRLLWAIKNPPYDSIIPYVNGPTYHPAEADTFTRVVLPRLKRLSGKGVYLVSGDVGLKHSLPLFFQHDQQTGVTYIAVGVGDTPDDAVLRVRVDQGRLAFDRLSLTGTDLPPVNDCGLDDWHESFATDRSPLAFVISKSQRLLRDKVFWIGLTAGALAGIVFSRIRPARSRP